MFAEQNLKDDWFPPSMTLPIARGMGMLFNSWMLTFSFKNASRFMEIGMDAKTKLNKFITATLGMMTYFLEEITKPSGKGAAGAAESCSRVGNGEAREVRRVTDSRGDEYLCPVEAIREENFVAEQDKTACFDYNAISEHPQV